MAFSSLRSFRILFLMCLVACAAVASGAQPATPAHPAPELLNLDGFGVESALLDGPWQFHTGDNRAWAAPGFDDSGWEQLNVGQAWSSQGHPGYFGVAWYRKHVTVSTAPGVDPEFALLIQTVDGPYEVYWNGVLVGQNGKLPPHPVWYWSQPAQTFGLGKIHSGVLAIRTWKSPPMSADPIEFGGIVSLPSIGTPAGIALLKIQTDLWWLRVNQLFFDLDVIYALVALLSLLAWFRDRSQWLLFWTAGLFAVPPLETVFSDLRIRLPYTLLYGETQLVFPLGEISLWFLLLVLLDLRENEKLVRWARIAAAIAIALSGLDAILVMFFLDSKHPGLVQIADGVFSLDLALGILAPALVVFALFRRRKLDYARWLVAIFAFVYEMANLVYNISCEGQRFTHWTLAATMSAPLFEVSYNPITVFTVTQTLLLISVLVAVYRNASENRRRQQTLEQEFQNARELQRVLVPETAPTLKGFHLTSAYTPAQQVGGDFFQIVPLEGESEGSSLVVVGDVSGKGLKAAMAVSLIVGSIRMAIETSSTPRGVLAALNRRLHGRLSGGFVTCIALRLDPDGLCTLASAGHPGPFLNGEEVSLPGAFPLGLVGFADFEQVTLQLNEGDCLALYTDGLLEARSPDGELYGFERLRTLFATGPTATEAADAAIEFGQDDDITVLTMTRSSADEESSTARGAKALTPA